MISNSSAALNHSLVSYIKKRTALYMPCLSEAVSQQDQASQLTDAAVTQKARLSI